jgi:17beta-estradiol 17-dehydrogenase / very-long-chain 3-oxoacyl-CoA reductase
MWLPSQVKFLIDSGEFPMALHNVYSASKAFDDYLSRALSYEYPELDIISLRPSEVSTPMTCHKKDFLTISPDECAEGLLKDLSYEKTSNGPISHKLQSGFYQIVPERLFNYIFKNFVGPDFIQERKHATERASKQ